MIDKYGKLLWDYFRDASTTTHCILGAVSLYALYRFVMKKKYKLPPGPRSLPLIGNLLAIRNESMFEKVNQWQKKYGNIITVYLGPMRTIVISDIDFTLEAFVKNGLDFSDRPFFYSLHMFAEGSKSILTSSLGDTFKYQRKVASHAIRQCLSGQQLEVISHEVMLYTAKVIKSQKGPFSLKDIHSLCIFNIMHGLCFGSIKEFDDPTFREMVSVFDDFNKEIGNGFLEDILPLLRYWPTKKFTCLLNRLFWIIDFIQHRIDERRLRIDKGDPPNCLADTIILAQQELIMTDSSSLMHMTDVHARQTVSDVFRAAVDTTHSTLDWIFLVLVTKPDVQACMQKEIDEAVGENIPGKDHRSKLVYTEAVILEIMRLYPVAALGVPHLTRNDSVIGGHDIPAKTTIMINHYSILRDPKHWDDPLAFKPERFISEDGLLRNRSFIPFSVGPRVCPGESLARCGILYIVVGLLSKFSFSLAPGEKADFTPDTSFFAYRPADYYVVAKPR